MVSSSVVRLVPRLESFEAAVLAYRSGDLDRALSALHGRTDVRSVALRARILNRTQRPEEAIEELEPVLACDLSSRDAAELMMLKAYALANVDEPAAAEETFVEARIKALLSGSLALEAEVEASTAFLHFTQNRFEETKKAAERVLRVTPTEALWLKRDDSAYFIPITESRARAYNWLGLIAAVDGDYRSQASYTRTAIEELETSSDIDAFLYCTFLRNFAVLARDLDSPG